MPHTPSRRASVAVPGRNGVKAHQPFREIDLQRGKKTGKTVTKIRHDSDEFEPFEQVLGEAYTGDGIPRPVNKRSKQTKKPSQVQDEEYDNSGEVSMDIDSVHDSPSAYFHSTATVPSNSKFAGSPSRPLATSSRFDYDRIPSPKHAPRRNSVIPVNKGRSSKPHNPSGLRTELHNESNEFGRNGGGRSFDDSFDDANVEQQPFLEDQPFISNSNLSFTALAQDGDDNNRRLFDRDDDKENQSSPSTRRTNRRRGVSLSTNGDDQMVEDEIAEELREIDHISGDDNDETGEELQSNKRKKAMTVRKANDAPGSEPARKRIKKTVVKSTKKQPRISIYNTLDEEGLRRSKRQHYPPLDFWRLEKVVWGRRENGPSVVPVIKEIIRIPQAEPEPLGTKRRKRSSARTRSKSAVSPDPSNEEIRIVEVDNPELGWDDETQPNGIIWDYRLQIEVERRIAFPTRLVKAKPAQGEKFSYDKIFGDGNFVAAGQLIIPPGAEKPTKPTKDNTYLFYIIEGAIECKVHRSSFVLATGGMFMVPRGNQYYIKNICERDVKLFFAQARKVPAEELDALPKVLMPTRSPSAPGSQLTPNPK